MFEFSQFSSALFDISYVFAPICGFIPQIYSENITYSPLLSLLTIFANILKLFPSKDKLSNVLIYQFCFSILVHFYLIKTQLCQGSCNNEHNNLQCPPENSRQNTLYHLYPFANCGIIPHFRTTYKYFIFSVLAFIVFLGVLDSLKYSYFFMRSAVVVETIVSILHIKLLEKQKNVRLLSIVLLIGDLIKTYIFIVKFEAPKELILATLIQLSVNIFLVFR